MKFQQIESEIISAAGSGLQRPPVNLVDVAHDVGVVGVRRITCRDAFTHFQPTGPVIYLSQTLSGVRVRFIIAHELAHVMLRNSKVIELIQSRGQASLLDDEENLANRIAGTLLLPDSYVNAMRETRLTLARLEEVAGKAEMPLSMLIIRMATAGFDIALLHWRRGRRSWHVVDRPGTPVSLHGRVELSEFGRRAIDYLSDIESEVIIDCAVNGRRVKIRGQGYKQLGRREHALQFFAPTRDVWFVDAMNRYRQLG